MLLPLPVVLLLLLVVGACQVARPSMWGCYSCMSTNHKRRCCGAQTLARSPARASVVS